MKKMISDKTHRGSTPITVLGITVLALLMLVVIAATANTVAATGTENKVIKDYVPKYTNSATVDIVNQVGSNIVVSWAKAAKTGSKNPKAIFQVNVPIGQTRTITAPSGTYNQYVRTGGFWYIVNGHAAVKSGYRYTMSYYQVITDNNTVIYDGTGFKRIPDSQAPKI